MPNDNGQNYVCYLPKVEKVRSGRPVPQHNISSMIVDSEKRIKSKTPDELLEELKDRCFVRVSSTTQKLGLEIDDSVKHCFKKSTGKEKKKKSTFLNS